jgi:hypothetical protein
MPFTYAAFFERVQEPVQGVWSGGGGAWCPVGASRMRHASSPFSSARNLTFQALNLLRFYFAHSVEDVHSVPEGNGSDNWVRTTAWRERRRHQPNK